jgi:hypothetical protein
MLFDEKAGICDDAVQQPYFIDIIDIVSFTTVKGAKNAQ